MEYAHQESSEDIRSRNIVENIEEIAEMVKDHDTSNSRNESNIVETNPDHHENTPFINKDLPRLKSSTSNKSVTPRDEEIL